MKCIHHGLEFEMKDEWLAETNMSDFIPTGSSYKPDMKKARGQKIFEILIADIAPLEEREKMIGVFCNDDQISARERVIRILILVSKQSQN